MIIRIVRMQFTQAGVAEFLEVFGRYEQAIRSFPGCTYLELLRDADDPLTFVTLSHWESLESLEQYRRSELFTTVWGQVKNLFAGRSQAFSLITYRA